MQVVDEMNKFDAKKEAGKAYKRADLNKDGKLDMKDVKVGAQQTLKHEAEDRLTYSADPKASTTRQLHHVRRRT